MADPAPPPLFILAAPFSGASWLAGVLGRHPQLYALPQIFPFMAETVGELLDVFALSQLGHGDGLRRAVAELLQGGQGATHIAAADAWLGAHRALGSRELIATLAAAAAPRRLVIPDAEMPLRPRELRRFRAALPQAQWLHLVRHPWSQGCRFAAWLREQLFVPVDFRDQAQTPALPEPQLPWLRANRNLDAAAAEWPAGQVLRLSSESLDADFEASVASLCGALDLPLTRADLQAMARPQDWLFARTPAGPVRGGLEAEVWADFSDELEQLAAITRLDQPLPWRRDRSDFAPEVLALARQYGYS
ncbi:MAG: sulfotransferase [Stagnimonas sp.]|nr:sulfotransferase [Stagnimonas sp.]